MTIIAAVDGSALGNPGPAGWAWYVDEGRWAAGGWPHGTNNMGELTAVLELLRATHGVDEDLHILADSQYAINSITKWMPGWKRRDWRKADGSPVMNLEIMKALDAEMAGRRVTFEWVRGHAGHPLNEAVDRLANGAAQAYAAQRPVEAGPGFGAPGVESADRAGAAEESAEENAEEAAEESAEESAEDLFSGFEASDADVIVARERALLTDAVRGDEAEVAAHLHPDWREVGRTGRIWDRDGMLASIAPLRPGVDMNVLDISEIAPDVYLLLWRSGPDDPALWSSIWVRRGGEWVARFHQGTPLG